MPSAAEKVEQAIREDVHLQVALARDIVNYQKAARRLKEEHGWDDEVTAISRALMRRQEKIDELSFVDAWAVLAESTLDILSGLCALEIKPVKTAVRQANRLMNKIPIDQGEVFHFVRTKQAITLLLDTKNLGTALDTIDDESIKGPPIDGLGAVVLSTPHDAAETPGLDQIIASALTAKEIAVIFSATSPGEKRIVVRSGKQLETQATLQRLIDRAPNHAHP